MFNWDPKIAWLYTSFVCRRRRYELQRGRKYLRFISRCSTGQRTKQFFSVESLDETEFQGSWYLFANRDIGTVAVQLVREKEVVRFNHYTFRFKNYQTKVPSLSNCYSVLVHKSLQIRNFQLCRHVKLKDASNLTAKGLKVLKQHKVIDLEVNGLKITVNDLIACLGDWSLQNLRSLSVARGSFMDCSRSVFNLSLNSHSYLAGVIFPPLFSLFSLFLTFSCLY